MLGTFLAASVAIVGREEILLIQRNRAPSEGLWTLPGGRLEAGETTEQCALREVREEMGLTVVLVEHDIGMVMRLSDRITVLQHGQVIATGTPAEIRENADVRSAYLRGSFAA